MSRTHSATRHDTMHLKLLICVSLCRVGFCSARAYERPRSADRTGLQSSISNLQLLVPLAEGSGEDGPFSDIPADAFSLDPSSPGDERLKEQGQVFGFRANGESGKITKKDLSLPSRLKVAESPRGAASTAPAGALRSCLDYFQGLVQPETSSLEVVAAVCSELLDLYGVDSYRAEQAGSARGVVPVGECACCPHHSHHGLQSTYTGKQSAEELIEKSDESTLSRADVFQVLRLLQPQDLQDRDVSLQYDE